MENSRVLTVPKVSVPHTADALFSQLMKIGTEAHVNPAQIAADYVRIAMGPGKVSPNDFIKLRLYDRALYNGAEMRQFVGDKRMRDICLSVNYRKDWLCLLWNKVASISYLNWYGLPAIPIEALYAPQMRSGDLPLICDKSVLEQFLLRADAYPLFGKPVENYGSYGSVALMSVVSPSCEVVTGEGARVRISDLVDDIDSHYGNGYIFQPLLPPHPAIEALVGKRLATVRFLTIAAENGAQIFRACWKIPAGAHMADNYWRDGNLLAAIDLENGRILRATSGEGLGMREHTTHPDTKTRLVGFTHPQWREMRALALRGAELMRNVPLIGWDIACTDKGPVIVEMNEYPDSFLMQFADRRGLLDDTFLKFIEFQKKNRDAFNTEMKARYDAI